MHIDSVVFSLHTLQGQYRVLLRTFFLSTILLLQYHLLINMPPSNRALPCASSRRIRARDSKLLAREEALADARGDVRRACPCNVCISGVRDVLMRASVRKHLDWYGRHPFHRGSTEVCCKLSYL